jgi:hypothetical protein
MADYQWMGCGKPGGWRWDNSAAENLSTFDPIVFPQISTTISTDLGGSLWFAHLRLENTVFIGLLEVFDPDLDRPDSNPQKTEWSLSTHPPITRRKRSSDLSLFIQWVVQPSQKMRILNGGRSISKRAMGRPRKPWTVSWSAHHQTNTGIQ